jgi:protein-tyrosine phosphatase
MALERSLVADAGLQLHPWSDGLLEPGPDAGWVTNFRDLGGYPVIGGGETRWGQVFRAESVRELRPADLVAFGAVGIEVTYELGGRASWEPVRASRAHVRLELPSLRLSGSHLKTLRDRKDGERWVYENFAVVLEAGATTVARLFSALAGSCGPAAFHCSSGRHRTGLAAALLLTCLGVHRDTVLDDYETSAFRLVEPAPSEAELLVARGVAPAAADGMLSAPRWAMADALRVLDTTYGGVAAYLATRGGISDSAIEILRDRLVT